MYSKSGGIWGIPSFEGMTGEAVIGVSAALSNVPQQWGGDNISHSGGININLSGTIQLQDPNGNIHNWDNLTNNPQFISQITDKISMQISKNMNHSSAGDGKLMYGYYS